MDDYSLAISSELHIQLQEVSARLVTSLERRPGVFRSQRLSATVTDDKHAAWVWSVQINQGPSSATD